MEQETEELVGLRQPTSREINEGLELLNSIRIGCDQADADFKTITSNPDVTRKEVSKAFDRKQLMENQYMGLCDWLWEYTDRGFFFDHVEQRYVLRS